MSKKLFIGERGIFVTCSKGKEKKSFREVLAALNSFYFEGDKEDDKKCFEDDLNKELKNLKKKIFFSKNIGVPCVFFISFPKEEKKPSRAVEEMVNKAWEGDSLGLRTTEKLYPVDYSCGVDIEEIVCLFKEKLFHILPKDKESFSIICKKWYNTDLNKEEIKQRIATEMSNKYKVNLTKPDFSILVIVCKFFCGLSLSINYKNNKENNLKEILKN